MGKKTITMWECEYCKNTYHEKTSYVDCKEHCKENQCLHKELDIYFSWVGDGISFKCYDCEEEILQFTFSGSLDDDIKKLQNYLLKNFSNYLTEDNRIKK